jgi:hypothetical protein
MIEWRAPEDRVRAALATQAEPMAASEAYLFEQGYISSDWDDRQRAIRDAARDSRMLRQAPALLSGGNSA